VFACEADEGKGTITPPPPEPPDEEENATRDLELETEDAASNDAPALVATTVVVTTEVDVAAPPPELVTIGMMGGEDVTEDPVTGSGAAEDVGIVEVIVTKVDGAITMAVVVSTGTLEDVPAGMFVEMGAMSEGSMGGREEADGVMGKIFVVVVDMMTVVGLVGVVEDAVVSKVVVETTTIGASEGSAEAGGAAGAEE